MVQFRTAPRVPPPAHEFRRVRDTWFVNSLVAKMSQYEATASWAVWPTSETYTAKSDLALPMDGLDALLHKRTVILGLNRGNSSQSYVPWGNFHTSGRHNDHFLAAAFKDTPHWGSYMTDLLSEVNSKSRTLDLRKEVLGTDIHDLIAELKVLAPENPLFILIGKQAARSFEEHSELVAQALSQTDVRWVTVPHYSAANGRSHQNDPQRYRDLVLDILMTRVP